MDNPGTRARGLLRELGVEESTGRVRRLQKRRNTSLDGRRQSRRVITDAQVVQGREGGLRQVAGERAQHSVRQCSLILVRPVSRAGHGQLICRVPHQFPADGLRVISAVVVPGRIARLRVDSLRIRDEGRLAIRAVGRVRNHPRPTVANLRGHGNRGEQSVLDDRQVRREPEIAPIEAAARRPGDEARLVSGRVRHDADRAAFGVGPKQCALRAFENLNPIHVEEVLVRPDGTCEVHTVEINAHGGVQVEREVVLTDTANGRGQHRAIA
jgi:hypothetical protein